MSFYIPAAYLMIVGRNKPMNTRTVQPVAPNVLFQARPVSRAGRTTLENVPVRVV